jgi:hypothetical protein
MLRLALGQNIQKLPGRRLLLHCSIMMPAAAYKEKTAGFMSDR